MLFSSVSNYILSNVTFYLVDTSPKLNTTYTSNPLATSTKGLGPLFNSEDEPEQIQFGVLDEENLDRVAKESLPQEDDSRLSELSRRNTLCLPHLRTSYPVETQMGLSAEFNNDLSDPRRKSVAQGFVVPKPVTKTKKKSPKPRVFATSRLMNNPVLSPRRAAALRSPKQKSPADKVVSSNNIWVSCKLVILMLL